MNLHKTFRRHPGRLLNVLLSIYVLRLLGKIENFRTVCKSYLETRWKSNTKLVRDKIAVPAVD